MELLKLQFLVDTLEFRVRNLSLKKLLEFLKLSECPIDWIAGNGRYDYPNSISFEGITILYGGLKNYSCRVTFSGKGCRTFEDFIFMPDMWIIFLQDLISDSQQFTITRIDIACDDYTDALNIQRLVSYYDKKKYSSKCTNIRYVLGSEECFYVGSPQSEILLRIYNKKLERGYTELEDLDGKLWYRAEIQLRNDKAVEAVNCILKFGIGPAFQGILQNHIRFTTKPNINDNAQRLKTASFWKYVTSNSEKIVLPSVVGSEYNKQKIDTYFNQFKSTVKTMILSKELSPIELYSMFTDSRIDLNYDQETYCKKCKAENDVHRQIRFQNEVDKILEELYKKPFNAYEPLEQLGFTLID